MSLLALAAGPTGVVAAAVAPDGTVVASAERVPAGPAPDELWRAVLAAAGEVLAQVEPADVVGLGITGAPALVLWDRDTLGSPRTIATGPFVPGLRHVAEHEPHTWALVEADRYAVGDVGSYLLARATRGLEHATDPTAAARTTLLDPTTRDWSEERCAAAGVPLDALPELVPTWGLLATTEPSTFLGLSLPVTGLVAAESAAAHGGGAPALGAAYVAGLGAGVWASVDDLPTA
ncbi:MAG: glpK 2 [Nocardioides sp.]|nr:glpK 2 [Nocardioides sp.]